MFLEYGLNQHGEMIHIDLAARGLGDLRCPYCNGVLIARKGSEKIHHFAHAGETCREVSEREAIKLPLYDKFGLGLSPSELQTLEKIYKGSGDFDAKLYKHGFIKETYSTRSRMFAKYEPTHLGNIPFGATTLQSFSTIQLERMLGQHEKIEETIAKAWQNTKASSRAIKRFEEQLSQNIEEGIHPERQRDIFRSREHAEYSLGSHKSSLLANEAIIKNSLADLNIYRAQLRRIFAATLYFLEIVHNDGILYKVGITNRLEGRIEEISRDLAPHLSGVKINVLRQLQHRGAIEFYFKHRYGPNQHRLGSLTEYFLFDDRKNVLRDISALGDYAPDDFMLAILNNGPSTIEREIEEETRRIIEEERQQAIREAHRAATKQGMSRAAAEGIHVGRPRDETETILAKYPQVVAMLEEGRAVRTIARETGINKNTVKKVREAMNRG